MDTALNVGSNPTFSTTDVNVLLFLKHLKIALCHLSTTGSASDL